MATDIFLSCGHTVRLTQLFGTHISIIPIRQTGSVVQKDTGGPPFKEITTHSKI